MTLPRNRMLLALAVIALAQTGVLATMVVDRVRLIKTGREITLPIIPVDPRDLFRGEYVRLGYAAARLPTRLLEGPRPREGAPFYVVLERNADGAWTPVKATRAPPQEASPDRIVLKARSTYRWPAATSPDAILEVRYGIERYFVPEGQGLRLEKLAQQKKMATLVAVDARGNAAIKGLIIDGKLQYEEPLF